MAKTKVPAPAMMPEQEWPLDKIKPYPNNPKTHPPEQVTLLASLLKKWGADQAIVVDETGVILKGHGRRLAALEAGLKTFRVIQRLGLPETEKQAMRIADNQVPLLGGWNKALIQAEISQLKLAGYDIPLLGFPETQLRAFGVSSGFDSSEDPDAELEPSKKPVVRRGDLWVLGDHRILCGDSTKADDVAKVCGGGKPTLMCTDPPYGVDYDPDWRNRADRANGTPYGASAIGRPLNDGRVDWSAAWKLFTGNIVYCWHAGRHASDVQLSLFAAGFEIVCQIIWAKSRMIISRGDYHWKHEPCWYAVRKGQKHNWRGDRSQTTLWQIEHQKSETGHSTQKPIECMKRPIENNSRKGELVYDPFVGSGTTIIACEMTGRKALAIEIDPGYVQVCIERWQKFTGSIATLDGKTLDQVWKVRRTGRARASIATKKPGLQPGSIASTSRRQAAIE